jgi:predicted  nucleic acid-binding Zn-ribbon protein
MTKKNGQAQAEFKLELPTVDELGPALADVEDRQAAITQSSIRAIETRICRIEEARFEDAAKAAKRSKTAAGQQRHLLNRIADLEKTVADLETTIAEVQRALHNLRNPS